jgi:nitrate/TMAO reductase-like tetraheme cytochrome c subunit
MGKAVRLFVLLLMGSSMAFGQQIPNPPPEKDTPEHNLALADAQYPSARVCGQCHPTQYAQWSISSHAYANVSPMFNKFEQTINNLASGTINYFCVRCHASVGTSLGERRDIAWWSRSGASKEGITCVSCHRVGEADGKVNGARRITPGNIHEPVFGPFDTTGVLKAISDAQRLKIQVSGDEPDREGYLRIHQQAVPSTMIQQSELCVPCHQVQVHPGIKLETVWEEYRNSPAHKEGITCQQCHMSPKPGQQAEFPRGPAAIVNGKTVNDNRPLTNHEFVGPGYPISHPGLFPIDQDSPWTPQQWLKFDYRAKWGSDEFERSIPSGYPFPDEWKNPADRKKAWEIVQANTGLWHEREKHRHELLENGSRLDGPFFETPPQVRKTFRFNYKLTNLNKGHNLPSGSLGAQPELWIDVALIDPDGKVAWESGDVDSYGDVRDVESRDVRARKVPFDDQLVNMQAKFITTNVKGTDREMYLPINLDFDQLPFIRPGGAPTSIINHPPFARMEKHSIPPLGTRTAHYKVPAEKMTKPGTYKLAIRMRGRTEPIYFMDFVGATTDMKRSENEWVTDTHAKAVEFDVGGSGTSEARALSDDPIAKGWFGPDAKYLDAYDSQAQLDVYGAKYMNPNPTGVPPVELGIRLYDRGAYTPRPTWLGSNDPINYSFMSYGDVRLVGADYNNGNPSKSQSAIAARLNLDMDLALTPTERFHAFTRPLDHSGQFTRYAFDSGGAKDELVHKFDFNLDTMFFEGDAGNIAAGLRGKPSTFDLPFAIGRFPFATQNGVWVEDAFDGAAFTLAAKNIPSLDVSNTDLTFFTGLRKVTTAAIKKSDFNTKVFGLAGFADAHYGYFEYGYGYVDADDNNLSYHNATAAFTKRYKGRLNNSVRLIGNFGQKGDPVTGKTADGVLLLVENSIIPRFTPRPNDFTILNFVPSFNFFAGFNSPQSLARGGDSGGVLRNTGINFESDGVTAYPTLDATARNSYGGAAGLEYLFDLHRQIILEGAVVDRWRGNTAGKQYALGARYQHVLTRDLILRLDAMKGFLQGQPDIWGGRVELRLKF